MGPLGLETEPGMPDPGGPMRLLMNGACHLVCWAGQCQQEGLAEGRKAT